MGSALLTQLNVVIREHVLATPPGSGRLVKRAGGQGECALIRVCGLWRCAFLLTIKAGYGAGNCASERREAC